MRRIAFVNEKGGSCKTTLSVNVAAWLARRGKRVLLLDLDPQGQAGKSLGLYVRDLAPNVFHLMMDPACTLEQAIRPTPVPNLDVVVSNKALADFPVEAATHPDRERKLSQKLADLSGYDYAIFDSPPSLGLLTVNVMLSASEIVVPVNLTYFALDGCAEIVETVERVKERFGKRDLEIVLVVPTLYRATKLADEIMEKLKAHFPDRTARTVIGYNVKIDEAQSHGKTIWEYAGWSRGAQMIEALAREIERRPAALSRP